MGGILNPSTLQSIVRYIQGLAITLKISVNNLPDNFQKFINAISDFFLNVWRYLPEIPDFDVRFSLIVLTFAIPVLLDFLCTWIVGDLLHNFLHLVDIVASFALFYNIAYLVMTQSKPISTILILVLCLIYLLIRGIILIINQIKKYQHNIEVEDLSLQTIITNIEKYYMKDIIPGIMVDYSEDDLENQIYEFNKHFVYHLIQPNAVNVTLLILIFLGIAVIILYLFGLFTPVLLPEFVRYSMVCVLIIFEIILFAVFLMIICEPLRESFLIIRNFVRRYGVKFVLLIMDFIYIPVGESIISNLKYSKSTCPVGSYQYANISLNQSLTFFINHETSCMPCTSHYDVCSSYCNSNNYLYSVLSPHLRLIQDILPTTMPNIAFGFIFVIIGLPLLTFTTILRTRSIVCQIPAFGRTLAIKWNCIVNKLNSPGLFSFYMYKYDLYLWSVLVSVQKLLLLILSQVTELVNQNVIYAISMIYLLFFILYIALRPFQYFFNNILEIIMAFCNCIMTLVPILSLYGKTFPSWLSIPLSVVACVLPIIAVPYSLLRKTDLHGKEDDGINLLDEELDPCRIIELKMIDLMTIWQIQAEKEFNPDFDPDNSSENQSPSNPPSNGNAPSNSPNQNGAFNPFQSTLNQINQNYVQYNQYNPNQYYQNPYPQNNQLNQNPQNQVNQNPYNQNAYTQNNVNQVNQNSYNQNNQNQFGQYNQNPSSQGNQNQNNHNQYTQNNQNQNYQNYSTQNNQHQMNPYKQNSQSTQNPYQQNNQNSYTQSNQNQFVQNNQNPYIQNQYYQNPQFNQYQISNNCQLHQNENITPINQNQKKLSKQSHQDDTSELSDSLEEIPVYNQQQQYYYAPPQMDYFYANQYHAPMSYANFVFDDDGTTIILKVMAGNLIGKIDSMYEMIDNVCDAATTYGIIVALKLVSIISAMCTGWFFGSVNGKGDVFNLLVC